MESRDIVMEWKEDEYKMYVMEHGKKILERLAADRIDPGTIGSYQQLQDAFSFNHCVENAEFFKTLAVEMHRRGDLYTSENYSLGKATASLRFTGRHWRYGVNYAKESIEGVCTKLKHYPWPPAQIVTGDKPSAAITAKKAAEELIKEGVLEQVKGPRGGFWVRNKVSDE